MRRRGIYPALLATGLLFWASTACSKKSDPWKGRIEITGGIQIAHNPRDPISTVGVLSLKADLTLGQESTQPGAVTFHNLLPYGCVDTDAEGNMYVLDEGAYTVFSFDAQGRHVNSFGRKGQGPGEFRGPACLKIMSDGMIEIVDSASRKLLKFSRDGTLLKEESLVDFPEFARPAVDDAGGIVAMTTEFGPRVKLSLIRIPADLKTAVRFADAETRPFFDGSKLNIFFPQFEFTVSTRGHVIWGFQDNYLVTVSGLDGRVVRKIAKDYDPVVLTEAAVQERLKRIFAGRTAPLNFEIVRPPSYWPFYGLIADEKGRLMARTPEKTADGKAFHDVFDERGRFLGRIPLSGDPVLWKNGYLFIVEEDPETGQAIRRYRVEWNPGLGL
ncbi:MAG: 6-bladed beta-propeller [Candidatus Aminicenantales bacterium]